MIECAIKKGELNMIGAKTVIRVCALHDLAREVAKRTPDLLVSIRNHGDHPLGRDLAPADRTLTLKMRDVWSGEGGPDVSHVREIRRRLDRQFPRTDPEDVLVHCEMGVSRSPAAAAIVLAHLATRRGVRPGAETAARVFGDVMRAAPHALPNPGLIRCAEREFSLSGYGFCGTLMAACDGVHAAARSRKDEFYVPRF